MSRTANRREFILSSAGLAAGVSVAADVRREVIGVRPPWEQTSDKKVRIGVVGGG